MKSFVQFCEFLEDRSACPPAAMWVEEWMRVHPQDDGHTLKNLWEDCSRADWMYWLVRRVGMVDAEDAEEMALDALKVILDTVRYDDEFGLNMALGMEDRNFWDIVDRAQQWLDAALAGDDPGTRFGLQDVDEHRDLDLPGISYKARGWRSKAIIALRKLESGNSWVRMVDDVTALCGDWGWLDNPERRHLRKLSAVIRVKYPWEEVSRAIDRFTE